MTQFIETLVGIFQSSGFAKFGEPGGWLYAVMICVGCFLLYLAIVKEFEPLILLPMAFGMILANLPGSGVIHMQYFVGDGLEHPMWVEILNNGGLADMLYMGVKLGIYPPLIFLGIGTMTDFAPLISNPKSLLLGAAAQFGIFGTYMGARLLAATGLVDFTQKQSAAIAIIGGADGPTAIFVTSRLAPELLGSIAVAAYSYMALVPVIQPPIMKALTSKKERTVVMKQLRTVSKTERVIFPIMVLFKARTLSWACCIWLYSLSTPMARSSLAFACPNANVWLVSFDCRIRFSRSSPSKRFHVKPTPTIVRGRRLL